MNMNITDESTVFYLNYYCFFKFNIASECFVNSYLDLYFTQINKIVFKKITIP